MNRLDTLPTNGQIQRTPRRHSRGKAFVRFLRGLIRKGQESVALAKARAELGTMAKQIENRDAALIELRDKCERRIVDMEETLFRKESEIRDLIELRIPKLERELRVAEAHIEYLDKLNDSQLVRIEAEIAVQNKRIVDCEGQDAESQSQAMRQLLRGGR